MTDYRRCTKCASTRPYSEFYKSKKAKSGYQSNCKTCANEAVKRSTEKNLPRYKETKKRYRSENNEYFVKKARQYYWQNPEKFRKKSRDWAANYKDQIAVSNARYKRANAARLKEQSKVWRQNNVDKVIAQNHARRVRLRENGVYSVSKKDINRMLNQPCFYCGASSQHLDHVVPVSRGGTHSIGNLVQSCASCNLSKSDKFITEWRRDREKRKKLEP